MPRLPFNFDNADSAKTRDTESTDQPAQTSRPMKVSDLAREIANILKSSLPTPVRVSGELSGLKRQTHLYCTLKDDTAAINAVMFAPALRKLSFQPRDGDQVIATGRIDFWPKAGRTQLYIERLEQAGDGPLLARLRALTDELRDLGYFAPERKRTIPSIPSRIAIVTSSTGAALQDVLDTARRRCTAVDISVVDVRVQGDNAAPHIARALNALSSLSKSNQFDTVILTRGGGSIEDLWAFNERQVADAVLNSSIPIVAAIGHETDTTLAELVADCRAATPTQAAMLAFPDARELLQHVEHASSRLLTASCGLLATEKRYFHQLSARSSAQSAARVLREHTSPLSSATQSMQRMNREALDARYRDLGTLEKRLNHYKPEAVYARREARLHIASTALRRAITDRLAITDHKRAWTELDTAAVSTLHDTRTHLDALSRELEVASPARILARGFSVTTTQDGAVITDASQASEGQTITTRVAHGTIRSTVNTDGSVQATNAQSVDPLPARTLRNSRAKRSRKGIDPNQHTLFKQDHESTDS